jgi:hypothetical protein
LLPWLGAASILLVAAQGVAFRLTAPAAVGVVLIHVAAATVLLGGVEAVLVGVPGSPPKSGSDQ